MNGLDEEDEGPANADYARARELQKYYQPWLQDSTALRTVPINDQHEPRSSVRCSDDRTLTALAQLAALRLQAKRAMVSLISADTQMILAEATKSLSLVDRERHAPGDHMWFGQASVPRKDAMDEHVFGSSYTVKNADGQEQTFEAMVVPDVTKDERFNNRPYVLSEPGVRFYAGVPIVTKQGYRIGVYGVSDDVAHPQGLSLDDVLFMQEVAQIITNHLERVKNTIDNERDEVFVKSMHKFIEGLTTLKHDIENPLQGLLDSEANDHADDLQATDAQDDQTEDKEEEDEESQEDDSGESPSDHTTSNADKTPEGSQSEPEVVAAKHVVDTETPQKDSMDSSTYNITQVFDRAATCLRDALDAQGCIFLDAAAGIFALDGALSRPPSNEPPTFSDADLRSDPDSPSADELEKNAVPLATAMADGVNLNLEEGLIKKKHLKTCLMRYPYGQYFYVDEGQVFPTMVFESNDTVVGSGTSSTARPNWLTRKPRLGSHLYRTHLPRQLLDQLPDVKWLIFMPLFNPTQGQWCAAAFIWSTKTSVRDLESAMPYLKTFGSCMMSEVTSLEAFNTSLAKSTLLASISHDLRSPLHGMLGSLEFLEDTMTTAYQMSLLGSVETCGKTLLDTIDHLLDYAKINNLNRATTGKKLGHRDSIHQHSSELTAFDFGLLLEEVVEAVFAGQTFRKSRLHRHDPVDDAISRVHNIGVDDSPADAAIHAGSAKFSGKVFFILDIFKTQSWCMLGNTGALRRVILNVVGNAVKYCSKGNIHITLDAKNVTDTHADVELSVKDTGVGMSQKFMENHLFKAFSQEDPFAPGAGLGLSIASSIVHTLNGKIRVESEKDVGTNVILSLPMARATNIQCEDEDIMRDAARVASGKSICMLNPYIDDESTGQLSKLTASMARTVEQYFNMKWYQSRVVDAQPDTSIFIYCEPPPIEYLLKHHTERRESGKSGQEAALLIICTNAFEAAALRSAGVAQLVNLGRIIEVISQPVGARKLAKVLLSCMQRIEASGKQETQRTSRKDMMSSNEPKQRAAAVNWQQSLVIYDEKDNRHRPAIQEIKWKSDVNVPTDKKFDSPTPKPPDFGDIKAGMLPGMGEMPHKDATNENAGTPPSVLLVDDNAINLKLLVTFMKKIKLPYAEAVNGLDAFNKFKEAERPFDFVLMDLQMPIMGGLESTRKIREYEKEMNVTKSANIIAITGVGNEDVRQEAMDAGMTQYLTKPVKFKGLQQLLEKSHQP
ncbi:hypothetical protein LTR64_000320 [Lithohypha guttulata]|uniref:uncharacterized protein n=1 Tax=Lithohypha guttulata TaxID=1690604 RepID=UPI002DDE3038|nr:hypothetical protein LTR51_007679 [Lithohypha guttulata]